MRKLLPAVAVLASLATAAPATASSLYVRDGVLHYDAAAGEANDASLFKPEEYQLSEDVTDREHFWLFDGVPVSTGDGCDQVDHSGPGGSYKTSRCDAAGVTSVVVDLGDGADSGGVGTDLPVTLRGGAGDDFRLVPPRRGLLEGGPGRDHLRGSFSDATISGGDGIDTIEYDPEHEAPGGVTISLDGRSGDGFEGTAGNVLPDLENVEGSGGRDTIAGSDGPNTLDGGLGEDSISGEGGDDVIEAVDARRESDIYHSPPIDYRPEEDTIRCGPGRDVVDADTFDQAAADCEQVTVNRIVTVEVDNDYFYQEEPMTVLTILNGSSAAERLDGSPAARNRILARGGNDRIIGGPVGDTIRAGSGNDVVLAHDSRRDHIHCGPGRDHVRADRRDRVARDCELVRRR